LNDKLQPVKKPLTEYRSAPMSLADACLARMSVLNPDSQVFTLDIDLSVYRKNGRRVIPVTMPK